MKKHLVLVVVASLFSVLSSCGAGYVSEQPTYVAPVRPIQPGVHFIWIEGEWKWNNHKRTYYHGTGHWDTPRRGENYLPGHWDNSRRGFKWRNGNRH